LTAALLLTFAVVVLLSLALWVERLRRLSAEEDAAEQRARGRAYEASQGGMRWWEQN
jgi:membrane protein implicated in regulation of membrane protease activity